MTRPDWQRMAEERLRAADALLGAALWPSAYYLAGYAVECGLKSCVLKRLQAAPELIFLDRKFGDSCWTHDIEKLVQLAGLNTDRDADLATDAVLRGNWALASAWNEKSRYEMKTQAEAESLYGAIVDPSNGVMQWIRSRW